MAEGTTELAFDVYGLRIGVSGDWPEVVEALRRDFAWFPVATGPEGAGASVRITRRSPDLTGFGRLDATSVSWRSVEYRDSGRRIVDFGRAVAIDDGVGHLTVDGDHGWMVWRASHDFLLGRIGEHLDRIGLARVNGLGLAGPAGATLVVLPMGGGKTTLALRALAAGGIGFLSEASPLLDRAGRLHPFPLPLLVRSTSPDAPSLPAEHLRRLHGIDHDPEALEVSAFRHAVPDGPVPLRHVVLGTRTLGAEPELVRIPWHRAAPEAARAMIAGFGILRGGGIRGVAPSLWETRMRIAAFVAALRGAQPWQLRLGVDKDANWNALARLL